MVRAKYSSQTNFLLSKELSSVLRVPLLRCFSPFSLIKCWVYLPMPWFNAHVLEQCL